MSTPGELVTPVPAARLDSSARLRRWAARRTRQLLRVFLVLSFVFVVVFVAALIWRGICLVRLPDVGDPFDIASVHAERMPDDRNAFVLFRQATARLSSWPDVPKALLDGIPAVSWSKTDPRIREWAEMNREALELFRRGAEQADGLTHSRGNETAFNDDQVHLGPFVWLALLECSRLEERGDLPGAWAWYRAVLGMHAHIMRRGTVFERLFATLNGKGLQPRVALWAADPNTRTIDLRRALDDVIAYAPRPEWESSSLKVTYLLSARELDRPDGILSQGDDEDRAYRIGGEPLPPNLTQLVVSVRRFLIHEPERSRRILRLAVANWLAHIEVPEERHRKPAVRVTFLSGGQKLGVLFYAAGPTAPASARRVSPQDLAQWLVTAPDAKWLLGQWSWLSVGVQERRDHRALVIALAEELYRRERGRSPSSDESLVGTYLKSLPDDGTADLDDGTTPTVEDSRASAKANLK